MQFLTRLFSRRAPSPAGNAASHASDSSERRSSEPSSRDESELHSLSSQTERAQRREQLYDIVRESMMRIGVLSSGYKFKVLALDPRGRQFLIMMDLADHALPEDRWQQSEELLAQAARERCGIGVKAVYWRVNHQLQQASARAPATMTQPAPQQQRSRRSQLAALDLPLGERPTSPAPLAALSSTTSRAVSAQPEPVEPDEVAALGKALAAARLGAAPSKPSAAHSSAPRRRPSWKSSTLAGFEDTRIFPDAAPGFVLGPTQYGELN